MNYLLLLCARPGLSFVQIFSRVTKGERPALHEQCVTDTNVHAAAAWASAMHQCLQGEPAARPAFADISSIVAQ